MSTPREKYERWLREPTVDEKTKAELRDMNDAEIEDAFGEDLRFGTGGLREVMGPGTNRMNAYTVRRATQGVVNWLKKRNFNRSAVIAYDSRWNSRRFAEETASVFIANGIKTYLFEDMRPTPELSFAVRYLKTGTGIIITASHNPSQYNGYKVYSPDGGQAVPYLADEITQEIEKIDIFSDVKFDETAKPITVGKDIDSIYLEKVSALHKRFGSGLSSRLSILYTPLHGTGIKLVPPALKRVGFNNVRIVYTQAIPDGAFPTVKLPNPEDVHAFDMALKESDIQDVDIIIGTDPDCDRIGVMVKKQGKFFKLTGNQVGILLMDYLLRRLKDKGTLPKNGFVVKTIVTTDLVKEIAKRFDVELIEVLTGFKFIGEKIKELDDTGRKCFLFGFEESYGYLAGTFVRDKDAVIAAMLIGDMTSFYLQEGKTLLDRLEEIYEEYGYFTEVLRSIEFKSLSEKKRMKEIMNKLRNTPPSSIAGMNLSSVVDYSEGIDTLPPSDVLAFYYGNDFDIKITVRPSGTEPKMKIYFDFKGKKWTKGTRSAEDNFLSKIIGNYSVTN
ncbi:MAG: phospho-sugar mutase [Thermotoga sp.]|nr:MAG: phospho-sugar mutase [Thermotoga sp.]